MALERSELIKLAKATAKASVNPSINYSYEGQNLTFDALNETFRKEMNGLASSYAEYRANKNLIFELIEVGIDEILPQKVMQSYSQFADVKQYAQGEKPMFTVRISEFAKKRAKAFVTRVGLAGRYEVFKLDGYSLEVPTSAYGGAAQIAFEEFLDGRVTMSDVYDLVLEGLDEAVYREIASGLVSMVAQLGQYNKSVQTTFNEAEMDKLLQIADAYGKASIYCTYEFAATMLPAQAWVSDNMKEDRWNNGYFTRYKGHNVIVLPQSFTDATNAQKVIDPSYAYIIPTGAEKPVKIALEGQTAVKEHENDDWSREIEVYKKMGVAVYLLNPGLCVYQNTSLKLRWDGQAVASSILKPGGGLA